MKISGFTIIKNAVIYDFPIIEAVRSILDICDEFVIVAGDSVDQTDELLRTLDSPKIKILKTEWSTEKYKDKGQVFAYQTDLALKACSGDWCIYLQSDEVIHHDSLPIITEACAKYVDDQRVEGFALKYTHFWADYRHYIDALHFAYPYEVRIVRNRPDIHSWRDAQSFRVIPNFDYEDYWQIEGTRKLNCILLEAKVFHYGWSRDPQAMVGKRNAQGLLHDPNHKPVEGEDYFDYGNLTKIPLYKGTHPNVMADRIDRMSWGHLLRYEGPVVAVRKISGTKYRLLSFVENKLLGARRISGFKSCNLIKIK